MYTRHQLMEFSSKKSVRNWGIWLDGKTVLIEYKLGEQRVYSFKGIVSWDWVGLQMILLDRLEVF